MKNNRWGAYTVKSRAKSSAEKALSPSTAGKAGRKAEKVGQSMGRGLKRPLGQSEHDMQVAVIDWCRARVKNNP